MRINQDRIIQEFCELTSIDSLSYREKDMKDVLAAKLTALGFSVEEDDAGERIGGNCGNLYCYLAGELPGPPLMFSGHMDTVAPGIGKRAILQPDGRITSDGTTILGADNVACLVEILEGIRFLKENKLPHRSIELVLCVAEELHLLGSAVFDCSRLQAKECYILDISGRVGRAAVQAPSVIAFSIEARGKAAHAGFNPEEGVNAIAAMARLIAETPQGRLEGLGTFNIGAISGGRETNIISEYCLARGEVRSFDHEQAVAAVDALKARAKRISAETGAELVIEAVVRAKSYRIDTAEPVVQRFIRACRELGLSGEVETTFGGSDNNVFVDRGLRGIVLSCGMYQVHSTEEYTRAVDLADGAGLVAALLQCD